MHGGTHASHYPFRCPQPFHLFRDSRIGRGCRVLCRTNQTVRHDPDTGADTGTNAVAEHEHLHVHAGDAKLDAKNPQLVYTDVVFVSYVWNQKEADDKAAAYLNTVTPLVCRALVKYSADSSGLRYRVHLLVPHEIK